MSQSTIAIITTVLGLFSQGITFLGKTGAVHSKVADTISGLFGAASNYFASQATIESDNNQPNVVSDNQTPVV